MGKIRQDDKIGFTANGLTNKRWKEYEFLLSRANKEQIEQMIFLAGLKLINKRVRIEERGPDDE